MKPVLHVEGGSLGDVDILLIHGFLLVESVNHQLALLAPHENVAIIDARGFGGIETWPVSAGA